MALRLQASRGDEESTEGRRQVAIKASYFLRANVIHYDAVYEIKSIRTRFCQAQPWPTVLSNSIRI